MSYRIRMGNSIFDFYGELGETDYHVTVIKYFDGSVMMTETLCGRDRASVWSDPEVIECEHFWGTVVERVRHYGGWECISNSRIGEKEYW